MRYLVVLLLAGCAVQPKPFNGPGGKPAYSMNCSGSGRTLTACYEKAGELCPNGYNVIGQSTGVVGLPAYGGTLMAPQRELAIECK